MFETMSGHVEGLLAVEREIIDEIEADTARRRSTAVTMLVLTVTAYGIARPLVALADDTRQMVGGDLHARPMERKGDAIAEIGTAFDDMRAYLTEMAAAA